jgi:hypothetical protein
VSDGVTRGRTRPAAPATASSARDRACGNTGGAPQSDVHWR